MKADAAIRLFIEIERTDHDEVLLVSKRKWNRCLLIFMTSASLTSTFGLLLASGSLLQVILPNSAISIAGTVLLGISFPLFVMTAHCLDRISEINRTIRIREFRKHLFKHTGE